MPSDPMPSAAEIIELLIRREDDGGGVRARTAAAARAYGDSSVEAAAKRDQAMALLFLRSG